MSFNIVKNILNFLQRSLCPRLYGLFDNPITGFIAAGPLGGLYGLNQQQEEAQRRAGSQQGFQQTPVQTGVGGVSFQDGTPTAALSPQYQAIADALLQSGAQGLGAFEGFDPSQAASLFTQNLDALAAPREKQQQLGLENRLFAKGLTGATGGQQATQALFEAQGQNQFQRDLAGQQFGTAQQRDLLNLALGQIDASRTLEGDATALFQPALGFGRAETAGNVRQSNLQLQGDLATNDLISSFFSGLTPAPGSEPQGNFLANLIG